MALRRSTRRSTRRSAAAPLGGSHDTPPGGPNNPPSSSPLSPPPGGPGNPPSSSPFSPGNPPSSSLLSPPPGGPGNPLSSSPLSPPPDEIRTPRGRLGARAGAAASSPESGEHEVPLRPITLEVNSATKNVNAWDAVKNNLLVRVPITPTQAPLAPTSWRLLEVYDNRAYEVVDIVQINSYRRRRVAGSKLVRTDAQGNYINEPVTSWEIIVQDAHRPYSDPIHLYRAHEPTQLRKTREVRGGALETRFCSLAAARRVGRQACDRLNRLPKAVSPDSWNSTDLPPLEKSFLEMQSMSAISANFDHSNVDPIWRVGYSPHNGVWSFTARDLTIEKRPAPEHDRWTCATYDLQGERFKINFKPGMLDVEKVEELRDRVPQSLYYRVPTTTTKEAGSKLTDAQHDAGLIMARYLQHSMWSQSFTHAAANTWVRRQIEAYSVSNYQQTFGSQGPCDGKAGWYIRDNRHIVPMAHLSESVEGGQLPQITLLQKDDLALAYVQQCMFLSLIAKEGLLNAWQAGCVAADIVNTLMPDMIDTAQMIESHCLCEDDEDRQAHSHYCMHDSRFVRCCNGVRLSDGKFVCEECIPSGAELLPRWTGSALLEHIRGRCYSAIYRECRLLGVPFDSVRYGALVAHCQSQVTDRNAGAWVDAWNGSHKYTDTTYRDVNLRNLNGFNHLIPHFLRPSPDHVLPYIRYEDGIAIHVASNVVLTTWAANAMRGPQIPSVLYLMRRAREEWLAEQAGSVRNERFWTGFHIALDHAMMIQKMAPWSTSKKLFQKFSQVKFDALSACYMSGEFVGSTLRGSTFTISSDFLDIPGKPFLTSKSRSEAYEKWLSRGGRKEWEIWSDEDWADIHFIHDEIRSSQVYNPKDLQIPLGPGGCEYPFILSHMPDETDPQKFRDFICREFITHWRRMDEACNWAYITYGSPKTLFLTCLIWWYSNGGRDEMFGCALTFYTNHMCTYAVGRRPEVVPGSAMHDGWQNENPKSLSEYNPHKRTLTFQASSVNRLCAAFPQELLDQLPELVLSGIRRETPHYNATRMDMSPINFPKDISARPKRLTHNTPPWDDFLGLWRNTERDNDDMSVTGQPDVPQDNSLHGELARFERRVERGERLEFNLPALAVLEKTRAQPLQYGANGLERDPLFYNIGGVCAAWVIAVSKVGRDGDQSFFHDDLNAWLSIKGTQEPIPSGTVAFGSTANAWLVALLEGNPDQILDTLGNPFDDTPAANLAHEVTRAVMIHCNGSHFVVLAYNFDEATNTGRIEYWNSSQSVGDEETRNYRHTSQIAHRFGQFLARQPQVDLPDLTWDDPVQVMPQTRQNPVSDNDCGPLSVNAFVNAVYGRPTEVHTGRARDKFSSDLRYKFLSWAFEAYMGVESMPTYVQQTFTEEVLEQRRQARIERDMTEEERARLADERRRAEEERERAAEEERRLAEEERLRREQEERDDGADNGGGNGAGSTSPGGNNGDTGGTTSVDARLNQLDQDVRGVRQTLDQLGQDVRGVRQTQSQLGQDVRDMDKTLRGFDANLQRNWSTLEKRVDDVLKQTKQLQGNQPSRGPRPQPPPARGQPTVGSSSATSSNYLRLMTRRRYDQPVIGAVGSNHLAYHYQVLSVQGETRQVGYPGRDGFFAPNGSELASWDDSGDVVNIETGNTIGNYIHDDEF
ncbi:hypothetical protein KCU65_g8718, partial [Aureobasidium melanogenum]